MKQFQNRVASLFNRAFGRTPLKERIDHILSEAIELSRFTDMKNLREECGDLLATTIQLASECGWDVETLLYENEKKINDRLFQYKSLARKKNIAILGGAFDPPHYGHLKVARAVLDYSNTFDEVWIMPCFKHMYNKEMEDSRYRLAMCRKAVDSFHDSRIRVSDYEIKNELAGETYKLVKQLLDEQFAKKEFDFSMVIGFDNALTFNRWVNYKHLEKMIRFVVVPRSGIEINDSLKRNTWFLKRPHMLLQPDKGSIPAISSTEIRELIRTRKPHFENVPFFDSTIGMLPELVSQYILNNRLYGIK